MDVTSGFLLRPLLHVCLETCNWWTYSTKRYWCDLLKEDSCFIQAVLTTKDIVNIQNKPLLVERLYINNVELKMRYKNNRYKRSTRCTSVIYFPVSGSTWVWAETVWTTCGAGTQNTIKTPQVHRTPGRSTRTEWGACVTVLEHGGTTWSMAKTTRHDIWRLACVCMPSKVTWMTTVSN